MWVLHILKEKLKRFTTSRKKRLKKIIIRMNKYVNKQKKGYNTLDKVLFIMGQAQTRRRVWREPIVGPT